MILKAADDDDFDDAAASSARAVCSGSSSSSSLSYDGRSPTNVQLEIHVKSAKSQLKSRLNYLLRWATEGLHPNQLLFAFNLWPFRPVSRDDWKSRNWFKVAWLFRIVERFIGQSTNVYFYIFSKWFHVWLSYSFQLLVHFRYILHARQIFTNTCLKTVNEVKLLRLSDFSLYFPKLQKNVHFQNQSCTRTH